MSPEIEEKILFGLGGDELISKLHKIGVILMTGRMPSHKVLGKSKCVMRVSGTSVTDGRAIGDNLHDSLVIAVAAAGVRHTDDLFAGKSCQNIVILLDLADNALVIAFFKIGMTVSVERNLVIAVKVLHLFSVKIVVADFDSLMDYVVLVAEGGSIEIKSSAQIVLIYKLYKSLILNRVIVKAQGKYFSDHTVLTSFVIYDLIYVIYCSFRTFPRRLRRETRTPYQGSAQRDKRQDPLPSSHPSAPGQR